MPEVYFPYINIALDSLALAVSLILLSSCFREFSDRKNGSGHFFFLICSIILALIADIVCWFGEGVPSRATMTVVAHTVASCAGQIAILCFMGYLRDTLYEGSRATAVILRTFRVLCLCSLAFSIGNAFYGYSFEVNRAGHYVHTAQLSMGLIYFAFPFLSFIAIILMTVFAKSSAKVSRVAFLIYTLFPVAGIILDYTVHGFSLTYVGLTVSTLVIYTSIYLNQKKLIEAQRNALMLSQINPHFVYNTLSTIASMCDVSPKQAKYLTIDFSRYLRQNLSTLSIEEVIPFEQELNHVECYLKIEQARFRERLNVLYSIQCKDFEIPPLSVQPLVENAVKHGVTKKAEGGTVKISTYETNSHYVIEIKDDGIGFSPTETADPEKSHVGLHNVQSRIASMCRGEMTIKSTPGIGTRVTLEIPKKKGRKR